MRLRTLGQVGLVSMLSMLISVACGGSSTATQTGPIVISMIGPLTGQYAPFGTPLLEGAETAAKVINDNGGVLGRKLQIDQVDTIGDPGDAVTALNKEIATGQPVALIGPISLEINAVAGIFDRHHIVDGLNAGSSSFDNNTDKWLWRCNASDSQLSVAEATYAHEKGYKTAVAMISTLGGTLAQAPPLQKAFETLGGTWLGTIPINNGQTSYRTEVQKVIDMHPDVIFSNYDPGTGAVIFNNFQELDNLAIPFIGADVTSAPEFIKAVGPAVAKAHMVSVQGSDALTSSGQAYNAAYQSLLGHAPLSGAAYGFDCTMVFALAMEKAGSSDPNQWVNAVTEVSNPPGTQVNDYKTALADLKAGTKINYEGVSGPMDFDKFHNVAGAWDVMQATGNADAGVNLLETISADQIQQVLNREGTS